ncbi:HugZ family protein [Paraglaciecola marina]|uniref:HugZ family pyridoxamine 5'-phosphate oxidase n=1 Tax=Paraglaciecola marina TaxID=2500157 RepID=UPI00105B2C84|nr:DUF2470 domain-containing protein [Paraglaciecola marina]
MKKEQHVFDAKTLTRQQHSGVLSTLSVSVAGYPFGSIVPYFMTHEGNLIIYISDIAQHTRNIKADSRVSMTIFDNLADDSQASGRVTVLGDAEIIKDEKIAEQYYSLFPQAIGYKQTHDFNFYEIKTKRVRYIGGFGKIFWISQDEWQVTIEDWHSTSAAIVEHMNDDHLDAMQLIVEHQFNIKAKKIKMLSAFNEGTHIAADEQVIYMPFEQVCADSQQVRQQLVAATHAARAALTPSSTEKSEA